MPTEEPEGWSLMDLVRGATPLRPEEMPEHYRRVAQASADAASNRYRERYTYPPIWSRKERLRLVHVLAERDGWQCSYCPLILDEKTAQIDHIVARFNGGSNEQWNLTLACGPCNRRKGAS